MQGTLRRAQSKRHHIIFGRRGSGKTSLLLKSVNTLDERGVPVAWVDLEAFKGHRYPDVLISVLLAALTKFQSWLANQESFRDRRTWYNFWLKKKKTSESHIRADLSNLLKATIAALRSELHLADQAQLVQTRKSDFEATASAKAKIAANINLQAVESSVEEEIASGVKSSLGQETQEAFSRSKIDLLHRSILDYHRIFDYLSELTGGDCFLFLDDLYHIARSDQPHVLDYFHRIAKGHNLWLKVGTIKHRSTWYLHSPQPMGLKIGDDADEIDLDLTLEKFSISRNFLTEVTKKYIAEAGAPLLDELLSDGGLNRLVIASGGVTRDFIGILRRSIDEARNRLSGDPASPRGEKIGAEDVNMAAGSYDETKRQEFQRDTLDDRERLLDAFYKIRTFCLEKTKTNVFLMDQETTNEDSERVQELIDLRLVHHVKSRVTVSDRPGRAYRALLLDVSQYTGARKRRNLTMLEFWKDDRDLLRKAGWIYDPTVSTEKLRSQIDERERSGQREAEQSSGTQPPQGEFGFDLEQEDGEGRS